MLLGQTKLKAITDYIIRVSLGTETEVLVFADESALTRFANNQIHQNVAVQNLVLQVRVLIGKKQGVASANLAVGNWPLANGKNLILNPIIKKKLADLVDQAFQIAKLSPADPVFSHLPGKTEGVFIYPKVNAYSENTATSDPVFRAKRVGEIIKKARSHKLNAFGSLSGGVYEIVVANSHGVFAYHEYTQGLLNIRIMGDASTGYAGEIDTDVTKINFATATERAISKTLLGAKSTAVKPGTFDVILEEPCVSEMMTYLSYLGFGGRAFQEDRSFLSGNLNKKVMGKNITIWDDATSKNNLSIQFDFQGMPKKKIVLIEKGIAKNVLYDQYLAQKYQTKQTGHRYPAPGAEDAYAGHLFLAPGSTPRNQLLKGMKRGILVSRFWYVRNVHPKELSITGMTRDGTFLVENGEVVSGVNNMRFTISIPKILSQVSHLSQETRLEPSDEGFGASRLPAIRAKGFTFTGVSKL